MNDEIRIQDAMSLLTIVNLVTVTGLTNNL